MKLTIGLLNYWIFYYKRPVTHFLDQNQSVFFDSATSDQFLQALENVSGFVPIMFSILIYIISWLTWESKASVSFVFSSKKISNFFH